MIFPIFSAGKRKRLFVFRRLFFFCFDKMYAPFAKMIFKHDLKGRCYERRPLFCRYAIIIIQFRLQRNDNLILHAFRKLFFVHGDT